MARVSSFSPVPPMSQRRPPFDLPQFDYAAFERDLADAPPGQGGTKPPPPPIVPLPPRARDTVATYDVVERGPVRVVTLAGPIDERFPARTFGSFLAGPVLLNLHQVVLITSFGLRAWLDMLRSVRMQQVYVVAASPAVVREVAMVRPFIGEAKILSVVGAMRCRCGAEFGVLLNAFEHRRWFEAPGEAEAPCPRCGRRAELDESPATYFGLLRHLAPTVPEVFAWALEQDAAEGDMAAVTKSVEGSSAQLRFHGPLPHPRAFVDALAGLRGHATLNLVAAIEPDPAWVRSVVEAWRTLPSQTASTTLAGAPLALALALVRSRPANTHVTTVRLPGARPGEVVDLANPRAPKAFRAAIAQVRPLRPPTRRRPRGGRLLVGAALLTGLITAGLALLLWGAVPAPPEWSHGSPTPPDWVTALPRPVDGALLIGVVAEGATADEAIAMARLSAWDQLRREAMDRLSSTPEAPAADATTLFYENVGDQLRLTRAQTETADDAGRVLMAVQFRVPAEDFDAMLAPYQASTMLGPLAVRLAPPWEPAGLLLATHPELDVRDGDHLVAVDGRAVTALDHVRRAQPQWKSLTKSQSMPVRLTRGGSQLVIQLQPGD